MQFGEAYEDATVREVVEAWEAVNVLSDVFLDVVRGTRGILGRDNSRHESAAFAECVKTLARAASARDDARGLGHGHRHLWAMYAVSREARLRCFRGPSTK